MTDLQRPRRGSLAYNPRKRAASQMPSITHWAETAEARLLGMAGYKAGMTHLGFIDDTESPTKGQEVSTAVTVIEIPPLYAYGIRGYLKGIGIGDSLVDDAAVLGKLGIKRKTANAQFTEENADRISLLVYVQPDKTGIGKKHPERMEIPIGGTGIKEKLEYAKKFLGKEVPVDQLFKAGEYVDVIAITVGKGFQGPVKRFGVSLQRPKSTGHRRHVGTLGQWHPAYIFSTARRAGQMGYHKRTEANKRIMKVGNNVDEINPKGGFPYYGFVRNGYVLVKGSVPGPVKRLIRIRLGTRAPEKVQEPKLTYVSQESKV